MLAGIYYGSQYGGSTTSILMRIPGEAASVMTCIDGYAMAQKGRAGAALCIAAVGSFIAGTFGVIVLTRGRAAARRLRAALRPAGIHRAAGARPDLPRLHVVDVAGAHAADGLRRAAARLHRHRRHDRPFPLQLRHPGAGRRHRHRAGRGRAVRPRRNPVDAEHRPSPDKVVPPQLRELLPSREEWRAVGHADRARLGARLPGRHRAGLGAHHLELPLLRGGEAHLQARRRSSARARSPASPARNRPTMPPRPARSCRCWRSACRPARSPPC